MNKKLRIGLDIDDVLADFWSAYCTRFDTVNNPKMLKDSVITKNVMRILRHDKDFWINLKPINKLDFEPVLYCTKRVNNKRWTKAWLKLNGFPDAPVYQMYYQHGNKANMIKGRVDVFIDDSYRNVIAMNNSGVRTLLYHTDNTENIADYKLYSLDIESIKEAYNIFEQYA